MIPKVPGGGPALLLGDTPGVPIETLVVLILADGVHQDIQPGPQNGRWQVLRQSVERHGHQTLGDCTFLRVHQIEAGTGAQTESGPGSLAGVLSEVVALAEVRRGAESLGEALTGREIPEVLTEAGIVTEVQSGVDAMAGVQTGEGIQEVQAQEGVLIDDRVHEAQRGTEILAGVQGGGDDPVEAL